MKLKEFVKNSMFDVNCWVEVYRTKDGETWRDCVEPTAIFYGGNLKSGLGSVLEQQIRYITTDKNSCIIIEIG